MYNTYNAAVKTSGRYTLKIVIDDDPMNPREDCSNFGKMACWHKRYTLGDKHDYNDPDDFLKDLAQQTPGADIVAYVKDGKADGLTLEYDKSSREWTLKSYDDYFKKWYVEQTYPAPLDLKSGYVSDDIVDAMSRDDLIILAEITNLIMPLYLYDHSGITISTSSFRDRWDSGLVGWTYASYSEIAKEYDAVTDESIEKARNLLIAEVENYDCYLRGDCYGFQLFKDGEETDSCWGFLGSFDEAKDAIREYLPESA
ncbi:MAG: hypothetical protein LBN43_04930, partial [Oscillospiraceae bacterium]|nr:hypothetical protein [Oscillospiraceae bacterium]